MFDRLKNLFKKAEPVVAPAVVETVPKPKKPRAPRKPKVQPPEPTPQPTLTEKEKATLNNEPYVKVISEHIDYNNIGNGTFEIDFNDKFVLNLIKAGYKKRENDTDSMIVDRWFTDLCRSIVLEQYEQTQADPDMRDLRNIRSKNLGDGRSEVS